MNPLDSLAVSDGALTFRGARDVDVRALTDPAALARWRALGLLPLAAYLLKGHPQADRIPPDVRTSLEAALLKGRAVAARWAAALDRVAEALARATVPVVLFKGADFAFHVYPDPGLRSMVDLDLVVPLARLDDAQDALRRAGFRDDTSCYSVEWYRAGLQRLAPLVDDRSGVEIEVHGSLVPSFSPYCPPEQEVWSDTLASAWPACSRLSRTWAVWHLVWHATVGHARGSGVFDRATADLLALHGRSGVEPIDWPGVLALASATGLSGSLAELLTSAAAHSGCEDLRPVADEARQRASARRTSERLRFLRHRVRQLAPFLGSRRSFSPALWQQACRRPARLAASILRRSRERAPRGAA